VAKQRKEGGRGNLHVSIVKGRKGRGFREQFLSGKRRAVSQLAKGEGRKKIRSNSIIYIGKRKKKSLLPFKR